MLSCRDALRSALAVFAGLTVFVSANQALASSVHPSIVGGVEVRNDEMPFIVSLQNQKHGHFCGGSLIAPDWVLTAGHCIDLKDKSVRVIVRPTRLSAKDGEAFEPERIIVHPKFKGWASGGSDLALIHLNGISKATPIALNRNSITSFGSFLFTVAGWGYTETSQLASDILLKTQVPFVDNSICSQSYVSINDTMFCAGFQRGGHDSCTGDSGGPIFIDQPNTAPLLVGVVSWGLGCGVKNKYGVYADVNYLQDWIRQYVP